MLGERGLSVGKNCLILRLLLPSNGSIPRIFLNSAYPRICGALHIWGDMQKSP